jgi:hypothetical protein
MVSTKITSHPTLAQKRRRPLRAADVGALGLRGELDSPIEFRTRNQTIPYPITPLTCIMTGDKGFVTSLAGTPREAAFSLIKQLVRFLFFCLFSVVDVSFFVIL